MAAIGSLVFCTDCGNLLEANPSRKQFIICDVCGTQNKDTSAKVVTTRSKPSAFPSSLRTKLTSVVQESAEEAQTVEATIAKSCDKCGAQEVRYYEQQLRSADEGTTIFYTCPNCNNKWTENN